MTELTTLLDGSIDDVKAGLAGKSHDDLLKLQAAEKGGKTRKGVLEALDEAIGQADVKRAGGTVQPGGNDPLHPPAIAADIDGRGKPADIAPATEFDPSGAPRQVVPDVDPNHPAVDNDPRAGTTEMQNRIDFNDPTKTGQEVVEEALKGDDDN